MFACTDYVMNGTVTMQTITSLIDKPTFKEAVQYFKEKCGFRVEIDVDTEDRFSYTVRQAPGEMIRVCGEIQSKPLTIL